jgi:hypothetical protein
MRSLWKVGPSVVPQFLTAALQLLRNVFSLQGNHTIVYKLWAVCKVGYRHAGTGSSCSTAPVTCSRL